LQLEPGELGYTIDEAGDIGAELAGDLGQRDLGILDDVVQQRGDDAADIELVAGEDVGDRQGVDDVGSAIIAELAGMGGLGKLVGAQDQSGIGLGVIAGDAGSEFRCGLLAGRCGRRENPLRQPPGLRKNVAAGARCH
jgi:hypothetical protein